jgi:hypothetical protein
MVRSFSIFILVAPALAQAAAPTITVSALTRDVLSYLAHQQVSAADGDYVAGEWRSEVYSTPLPALVGVGHISGDEESTAFATAGVVNELEMIRAVRPDLTHTIAPMMKKAIPSFERYREGHLFNFYPPMISNGVRIHQPASMRLTKMWKGITNIPEDADTTSTVYTAKHFASLLDGRSEVVPFAVSRSFENFRDVNRQSHWYDKKIGIENTGAFLTWQMDENDPNMPQHFTENPTDGVRIPFKRNDVDCVVNMNVLRMMAVNKSSNSAGRNAACKMGAEIVQNESYAKCGIYYPNTYNFAYSASQADEAGETCMRPYASRMVDFILRNQNSDGGWFNQGNILELNDRVQSTAFAMLSLERFASSNPAARAAIRKGVLFLYSNLRRSEAGGLYWPGETFFTATAIARSLVDWRSDSFTTVVALAAIVRAEKALGGQIAQ